MTRSSPAPSDLRNSARPIVLGSRSPQRRDLLSLLVPAERVTVLPPASAEEQGFAGLSRWADIRERLEAISRNKAVAVTARIQQEAAAGSPASHGVAILCADTVIVGSRELPPGSKSNGLRLVDDAGQLQPGSPDSWTVLGQPPADGTGEAVVREWFARYLAGRTHIAATAVCLIDATGNTHERTACTEVTFHANVAPLLEWYLTTGEYQGRAGGYAIQGAGSQFVSRVEGSLSNVIGLPLEAVRELLLATGLL